MSIIKLAAASFTKIRTAVKNSYLKIDVKHRKQLEKYTHLLQGQLIKQTNQAINLVHAYKKEAIASGIAIVIATSGAGIGHTYYQSNVDTVYHVYFHDKKIGVVNNPKVITSWIEERIREESDKLKDVQVKGDDNLQFKKEKVYKAKFNNEKVLEKIKSEYSLKAQAVKVVVNGKLIGYAANEETVTKILDDLKSNYVTKSFLIAMKKEEKKKNNVAIASVATTATEEKEKKASVAVSEVPKPEKLALNKKVMVEAKFKEDIAIEEVLVFPAQVIDEKELKTRLKKPKQAEKVHVIKEGEVLGTIAEKYNLKLKQLLALNPRLKEDSLIQIGQKLVVTSKEPSLTVVTVEEVKRKELIQFQKEIKKDPKKYRDYTKVIQQGKKGKKLVEYQIIRENGKVTNKQVIAQEVLKNPTPEISVRGLKINPSRGTGKFSWPTVGGHLTSGFGQRWGRLHAGIDISGVRDRTIKAADHGKVVFAGWHSDYGNHVIINHSNGFQTLYAHLSSISIGRGDLVRQGQKLGVMGSTGRSTGVHLHFEILKNGRNINPLKEVRR